MDDSLVFEAWINSWSHACTVHRTGKGQTCSLEDLPIYPPKTTKDPLFEQRLLVENAVALNSLMSKEIWKVPCKKNVCKAARTHSDIEGISRNWAKLILRSFSRPTDSTYIIQAREDWRFSLEILTEALRIVTKRSKKISLVQIVANCVIILEYEVFKIADFNCGPLLKAISALGDEVLTIPEAVLRRLTKIVVGLSTGSPSQGLASFMLPDSIHSSLQIGLAQDLFDSWRASGVIGTACAEKLLQFLSSSQVSSNVFLTTLKQLALSGNAPSFARTPSVMEYLKHMAESASEPYLDRYNATLLLTELFPRHAWETISLILPDLSSAGHFKPFILTAFTLHDVPKLLELLPETYELLCEDECCASLAAVKASECPKPEILIILTYVEEVLTKSQTISLSWIALTLAIIVGSQARVKEEVLISISEILRGQDIGIVAHMIRYWSVATAHHYNGINRDSEIELTIMKDGPEIQYPPAADDKLMSIVLDCCKKWRKRVPRVIGALLDRLNQEEIIVFDRVEIPKAKIAQASPDEAGGRFMKTISSEKEFLMLIDEFREFFDSNQISAFDDEAHQTCLRGFKKIYSTWNYLIHRPSEIAEQDERLQLTRSILFFEQHVNMVTSAFNHGIVKLIEALQTVGIKMHADQRYADSIYTSIDQYSRLQRFLGICLRLCLEVIYRPLHNRKSRINYLWFDSQLCPIIHPTNYLFKASLWFYTDPSSPLPLKLGLAQEYAKFIEYAPKAFKSARLPALPVEVLERLIRAGHARVKTLLQGRDVVAGGDISNDDRGYAEELAYHRDVADFIIAAIG